MAILLTSCYGLTGTRLRRGHVKVRQTKYRNNIVEQDHSAIERRKRSMMGIKNFRCACILLGGIELMHMIDKGQIQDGIGSGRILQRRLRHAVGDASIPVSRTYGYVPG